MANDILKNLSSRKPLKTLALRCHTKTANFCDMCQNITPNKLF